MASERQHGQRCGCWKWEGVAGLSTSLTFFSCSASFFLFFPFSPSIFFIHSTLLFYTHFRNYPSSLSLLFFHTSPLRPTFPFPPPPLISLSVASQHKEFGIALKTGLTAAA